MPRKWLTRFRASFAEVGQAHLHEEEGPTTLTFFAKRAYATQYGILKTGAQKKWPRQRNKRNEKKVRKVEMSKNAACIKCTRALLPEEFKSGVCGGCWENVAQEQRFKKCCECLDVTTNAVVLDDLAYCRNCIPNSTSQLECTMCDTPMGVYARNDCIDTRYVICQACRDDCHYRVRPGRTMREPREATD